MWNQRKLGPGDFESFLLQDLLFDLHYVVQIVIPCARFLHDCGFRLHRLRLAGLLFLEVFDIDHDELPLFQGHDLFGLDALLEACDFLEQFCLVLLVPALGPLEKDPGDLVVDVPHLGRLDFLGVVVVLQESLGGSRVAICSVSELVVIKVIIVLESLAPQRPSFLNLLRFPHIQRAGPNREHLLERVVGLWHLPQFGVLLLVKDHLARERLRLFLDREFLIHQQLINTPDVFFKELFGSSVRVEIEGHDSIQGQFVLQLLPSGG